MCAQLPAVLKLLTQISLESMVDLIPDHENADAIMAKHFERVSSLCSQIQLDADKMNPRWNKAYGAGGTKWEGALQDGRDRGIPYYCPSGWARFALRVCQDSEFEDKFGGWGYLYHGTKGRHVGSILTSGFRAAKGCFCGKDDTAVYMSPSVEYCSHPRYGAIEYNPESGRWMQIVLQCRVDPKAVWQIQGETLTCKKFGLTIDPNIGNGEMEWLFRPNHVDPETGDKFIHNAIVCTGVMIRVTKDHPLDLPNWWSTNSAYIQYHQMRETKVDPLQTARVSSSWREYTDAAMATFSARGQGPCSADFRERYRFSHIGKAFMSPAPFANGSMRFAWYLQTDIGLFVVKTYNAENQHHIEHGLGVTMDSMVWKDVATYLAAQHYADLFKSRKACAGAWNWDIGFVEPCAFRLGGQWLFGERFLEGRFIKWNTNTGENNTAPEAQAAYMSDVAGFFSHFTYCASKGELMVVDIQGLMTDGKVTFTDPQIHTRSFRCDTDSRKNDRLYKRFSVGNLGKSGMVRFFANHTCSPGCRRYGLVHPKDYKRAETESVASLDLSGTPIGRFGPPPRR